MNMRDLFHRFFNKYGNKGAMLVIFVVWFAVNTVFSLRMTLPSIDPNEFGVAATGAFFCGANWTGVMSGTEYFYGYIQGLLYTPIMLLTNDPYVQYKALLVMNSFMISFVPILAYNIAARLGVKKPRQLVLCAFICGGYVTYFAHTKFIWNETVAIVLPWVLVWVVMCAASEKHYGFKNMLSVLAGFLCVVAFAAHERLIGVILALIITVVIARLAYRKKTVCLISFFSAMAVTAVLERITTYSIQKSVWQTTGGTLKNTAENFFENFASGFEGEGVSHFFKTLIGQLYYFVTSTWGFGGLAMGLFALVMIVVIRSNVRKTPCKFSADFVLYAAFSAMTVFFTLIIGTFYKYSVNYSDYQDTAIFGRFLDGVIPIALLFVLMFFFIYDVRLPHILSGVIALGAVYIPFFTLTEPDILQAEKVRLSPILSLFPLRIGETPAALYTHETFMLTASAAFCILALLIVIVCCAKEWKKFLCAGVFAIITAYSTICVAAVYLPLCSEESTVKNAEAITLTDYLYNQVDAPPITAYKTTRHTATMLQYLNQNTKVLYTLEIDSIPENCFIVMPDNQTLRFKGAAKDIPLTELADIDGYLIYAYGERALAYAQSQGIGKIDSREPITLQTTDASAE